MSTNYRIGYIDEDEGQVKKYARRLRRYGFEVIGYQFHKGMTVNDLMKQVYESDIDILLIDYKLKESNIVPFNGEEVEREIYENRPLFPHIIFTSKVEQAEPFVEDWKILFNKDEVFSDETKSVHFVTMLQKSIEQYKKHVNSKKKILSDLLVKGEKEPLSASEKDILLKTQKELQRLSGEYTTEIPEQFIERQELDQLQDIRKKAEEFFEELIKKDVQDEGKGQTT